MEIKKSPSANLENKKLSFTLVGLVIVLALVYITVEWTQRDPIVHDDWERMDLHEDDDLIPITIQDLPPPPPPEAPPPPPVVETIEIVDDDTEGVPDAPTFAGWYDTVRIQPPVVAPIIDDPDEDKIFVVVERMPEFPGGEAAMRRFLSRNIQYPRIAEELGIEGRVVVSFVVERTGEITDIQVMRGVDRHLDAEAVRVVRAMPRWTPGEQRGTQVRVKFVLPIAFRLS